MISPPVPERDFDPALLPPPSNASTPTLVPSTPTSSPPTTPEHLRNNHIPLSSQPHFLLAQPPPAPSDSSIEDFLLPKALTTTSVKMPTALVEVLAAPQDWLSEVIYILRPLVYGRLPICSNWPYFLTEGPTVSLLYSDRHSNRPLITAVMMEIVSRNLRRRPPVAESLERSEYARRDRGIFWYLFRGSIWQNYTKQVSCFSSTSSSHRRGLPA
jgi:peroxin-16